MRRLFEIIERGEEKDTVSKLYDYFLIIIITLSIIPLAIKDNNTPLIIIENVCLAVFVIDYLLRIITSHYKYNKGKLSFIYYIFSFHAIIDLIAILPSFIMLNGSFQLLKLLKAFRLIRCLRVFKALRLSKNFELICKVLNNTKKELLSVLTMAIMYILFTALLMFNVEPQTFDNFFDAIYWSVTALTTVGYGDIYPVSELGRIVSMISSLCGIAMVALPAGVITSGFQQELQDRRKDQVIEEEI